MSVYAEPELWARERTGSLSETYGARHFRFSPAGGPIERIFGQLAFDEVLYSIWVRAYLCQID
jgi:hypothetical protein